MDLLSEGAVLPRFGYLQYLPLQLWQLCQLETSVISCTPLACKVPSPSGMEDLRFKTWTTQRLPISISMPRSISTHSVWPTSHFNLGIRTGRLVGTSSWQTPILLYTLPFILNSPLARAKANKRHFWMSHGLETREHHDDAVRGTCRRQLLSLPASQTTSFQPASSISSSSLFALLLPIPIGLPPVLVLDQPGHRCPERASKCPTQVIGKLSQGDFPSLNLMVLPLWAPPLCF